MHNTTKINNYLLKYADIGPYTSKFSEYETLKCIQPLLLKCGIFSRFSNQNEYLFHILLDSSQNNEDQIKAYCCQCRVGLRSFCCSAHVMAILWFLGLARHLDEIPEPAGNLNKFFLELSHSDSDSTDTE